MDLDTLVEIGHLLQPFQKQSISTEWVCLMPRASFITFGDRVFRTFLVTSGSSKIWQHGPSLRAAGRSVTTGHMGYHWASGMWTTQLAPLLEMGVWCWNCRVQMWKTGYSWYWSYILEPSNTFFWVYGVIILFIKFQIRKISLWHICCNFQKVLSNPEWCLLKGIQRLFQCHYLKAFYRQPLK